MDARRANQGVAMPIHEALHQGAPTTLERIRVVLVEPQHPGNIGAVARAMKNMAVSRLILVNPADHLAMEARMMAMHAVDILQHAQVVDTLSQAVADAGYVVGTTRRLGKSRQAQHSSRTIAPLLLELAASNPVALVFGREDSGLSNDELAQCHELIYIPAHPTFGSLNLAQAVLLVCYELYLATASHPMAALPPLATAAELERLYTRMRAVLRRIGFLHGSNPDRMMGYFRRFFARHGLKSRDVKIFLGVFRQVEWYISRHLVEESSRSSNGQGKPADRPQSTPIHSPADPPAPG
jgi:tRNA/rRNA methyltransferase